MTESHVETSAQADAVLAGVVWKWDGTMGLLVGPTFTGPTTRTDRGPAYFPERATPACASVLAGVKPDVVAGEVRPTHTPTQMDGWYIWCRDGDGDADNPSRWGAFPWILTPEVFDRLTGGRLSPADEETMATRRYPTAAEAAADYWAATGSVK